MNQPNPKQNNTDDLRKAQAGSRNGFKRPGDDAKARWKSLQVGPHLPNGSEPKRTSGGTQRSGGGAAARAARRSREMASKRTSSHRSVTDADKATFMMQSRGQAKSVFGATTLKIIPIGGQDEIGSKNMQIVEYGNDAIVIDCGNNLGVDLPGINYTINDSTYLESIKHKIRGYIFTHGHLDHIGGARHILPKAPAPVYGTQFTLGMLEKQFEGDDFPFQKVVLNSDNHDRVKVGPFFVESVRVTHAIPDCSLMVIDTPVGKIVHTGDFRLDPEPLDRRPSDLERIKTVVKDGVLLLMSDSTNARKAGRTPTENTLKDSFKEIIAHAPGRVIASFFSSNMNRTQMTIDAAVAAGRRVAVDGRGMLSTIELAVKLGYVKIPKGTIVPIRDLNRVPDNQVVIICTGGQGEENAALVRMSTGEHQHVKLKREDTVVISSTPIPGNEISYQTISGNLAQIGVHLFRAITTDVDGCGPLHVSGHANRDELAEMIAMVKPKYFMGVHGDPLDRRYHQQVAMQQGIAEVNALMVNNGEVIEYKNGKLAITAKVPIGAHLVDQTGAVVPDMVIHDRILMSEDGIVVTVVTISKKSGQLLTSPDIITRGFIYMKENEELMNELRNELRRFSLRRFNRVDLSRFKQELRDHVTNFLYQHTQRTPIVIPVVNAVEPPAKGAKPAAGSPARATKTVRKPR